MLESGQFEIWDGNATNDRALLFEPDGDFSIDGVISQGSDVDRKELIYPADSQRILESVMSIPIYEWQFKGQQRRHIGPMAQDFHKAFGLGTDDTTIAAIDADGIAMAAIKAQQDLIREQKAEIEILHQKVLKLELLMDEIILLKPNSLRKKRLKDKRLF